MNDFAREVARCHRRAMLGELIKVISLLCLAFLVIKCASAQIPPAANVYKSELIRSARVVWGIDAPIATFAAQVHQESRWQPSAKSPAGALGIAQFMPATAQWMQQAYPQRLKNGDPLNPAWSLLAMAQYDLWLRDRTRARGNCDHWAMILSAYNGGLGWVQRDRKVALASGADPLLWFDSIEKFNAGRSAAHFKENRDYPRKILFRWEPLYRAAGWGTGVCNVVF